MLPLESNESSKTWSDSDLMETSDVCDVGARLEAKSKWNEACAGAAGIVPADDADDCLACCDGGEEKVGDKGVEGAGSKALLS